MNAEFPEKDVVVDHDASMAIGNSLETVSLLRTSVSPLRTSGDTAAMVVHAHVIEHANAIESMLKVLQRRVQVRA